MANESTAKLKSEVEFLRSKVDEESSTIRDRISARGLMDEVIERIRGSGGRDMIDSFYSGVKRNPVGLLLVGAGFTLLMRDSGSGKMYESASENVSEGVGEFREKASGAFDTAKRKVSELSERFQQQAKEGASNIQEYSGRAAEVVRRGKDSLLNHPVAVAGIGLSIGALLAAILPDTEMEQRVAEMAAPKVAEKTKEAKEKTGEMLSEVFQENKTS
jgi:hypothetical protein